MKDRARVGWVAACIALLVPMCGFAPDPVEKIGADLIVTAAPVYEPLAELRGGERFPKGAQLLLIHDGKAEPLVTGFAATADADVYFNGKQVLFAGKKTENDPWQIWELTLKDHSVRKVITTATDAVRPLYLPGARMVWAQRTAHGFELQSADDGHLLNYIMLNPTGGPGITPLTYLHTSAFPVNVLEDGRILFESGYPLGSGTTPELYLVYADGSGVESYRCDHGQARWGGAQVASGDVVFTQGHSLARFTSPLAHEEKITTPRGEFAGAITETSDGEWLVSARTAATSPYEIRLWKPGTATMQTIVSEPGKNLLEPVVVARRTVPRRHPSGLHPWDYANVLALDARLSRDGALKGTPERVRLEAQDDKGHAVAMGTAPVEKDGSFFVQVPGDRPIRFALLDAKGVVLRQQKGWLWIRGGEQRICVGCHTGPERSSENRVPAVLLRTTTPVDLTHAVQAGASQPMTSGGH